MVWTVVNVQEGTMGLYFFEDNMNALSYLEQLNEQTYQYKNN